jgi:dCMP deaminase
MSKWNKAYMDIASRISEMSSAKRLQVGAIAVKDGRIISIGYNGTPSGWDNSCEDENNVTKPEVLHAEENLITKLASSNESGKDADIFITHAPCINCAKLIYGTGIRRVYFKSIYRNDDGIKFLESCKIGVEQI